MRVRNAHKNLQEEIKKFTIAVKQESNEARSKAEFVDIIRPFEEILGQENVLILDGEFSITHPNEGFGRILAFLGVEKEGFEFEIDEEKGFPCLVKPARR